MTLTPTDIAIQISKILDVPYSHHDLHYSDYNFGAYSLLTAYKGCSPFIFSILENGKIQTLITPFLSVLTSISYKIENLESKEDDQESSYMNSPAYKEMKEHLDKEKAAEQYITDNNVIQILKDNLSPFYKDLLKKNTEPHRFRYMVRYTDENISDKELDELATFIPLDDYEDSEKFEYNGNFIITEKKERRDEALEKMCCGIKDHDVMLSNNKMLFFAFDYGH